MSDIHEALAELATLLGDARAALVLERSGIEVALWGEADFDAVAADVAELWRCLSSGESLASGAPECLEVRVPGGAWVVLPLGSDHILALHAGPGVPPGKALFYAGEWACRHRGDFA